MGTCSLVLVELHLQLGHRRLPGHAGASPLRLEGGWTILIHIRRIQRGRGRPPGRHYHLWWQGRRSPLRLRIYGTRGRCDLYGIKPRNGLKSREEIYHYQRALLLIYSYVCHGVLPARGLSSAWSALRIIASICRDRRREDLRRELRVSRATLSRPMVLSAETLLIGREVGEDREG